MITCVLGTWGIAVWYPSRVSGEQGKPALPDGPNYSLRLNFAMRKKALTENSDLVPEDMLSAETGWDLLSAGQFVSGLSSMPPSLKPCFQLYGSQGQ